MIFHIIQTSTDIRLLGLIYSMDCFKKISWPSIIVNSRFLGRPQKICRRNQLVSRRLIKTKIDRPIQTVRWLWCLELRRGGRYQERILGYWILWPKWHSTAFVQLVYLRPRLGVIYKFRRSSWHIYIGRSAIPEPYSRKNPRYLSPSDRRLPAYAHMHVHARTHTSTHAHVTTHTRTHIHADRHLCRSSSPGNPPHRLHLSSIVRIRQFYWSISRY